MKNIFRIFLAVVVISTITFQSCNTISDCEFEVNGVKFKMIAVEGGSFMMGATPGQGDDARENEKPAHKVTVDDFLIGETEVTQELWFAVMESNPSHFISKGGNYPVENVSWNDVQVFIRNLTKLQDSNSDSHLKRSGSMLHVVAKNQQIRSTQAVMI